MFRNILLDGNTRLYYDYPDKGGAKMTSKEKLTLLVEEMNPDQLNYLFSALTALQADRALPSEMQCRFQNKDSSTDQDFYLRFCWNLHIVLLPRRTLDLKIAVRFRFFQRGKQ